MRPVPTMYSSKRTPRARPPSLLYTSPESMKFIEKHDKDSAANFDKETSRQTRARLPILIKKPLAKLEHAVMQNSLFQERERPH